MGRILLIALAVLAVYLVYQPGVESLRTKNPTTTALIKLREAQAQEAKTKVSYRTVMIWRPLDQISPHLVHAVMLAEDDRFYQHKGFDLKEIRSAVKINWQKKRYAYGGSTITQQLARTLFLSPRKNLLRKLKEATITFRLERALPKKRILELYLNVAEWGRGIYGAEAASQFYYEKAALDLTPDEAIALASILPSPRRWSPVSEKGYMARRRTQLLERMQHAGYVPAPLGEEGFDPALTSTDTVTNPDELQGGVQHIAPDELE